MRPSVLSRQIAALGIYPAVDPLDSTSVSWIRWWLARNTTRPLVAFRPYCNATGAEGHHRHLGMDELSEEDKLTGSPCP